MRTAIDTSFGQIYRDWELKLFPDYVFFQEGPGLRMWQWTTSGMKVINVTNILQDGSIAVSNTNRYISSEEFLSKYSHFAVQDRDIVVASSGNTYGKVGRTRKSDLPLMMNTSVIRFHPLNCRELDADYLYAFIRSYFFKNQIEAFIIGSAQPNFGPTHIKSMQIVLPPISTQRKIAAILSAYDDLIENNTRRIAILEEMAQTLYREWFVHFRFPGHEKKSMVESALGMIPEGWEVVKLGGAIELAYGKALKADVRIEGNIPVYGSAGIVGYHNEELVKGPGIIVGRKGNVGSVFWSDTAFFPIDTVFFVRSNVCLHYLYYNLRNQRFINNDAAVPGLNRNQAYLLPFLLPEKRILDLFQEFIVSLFKQLQNLTQKNANLRHTRDLLLPKLISGEVDVEGLEIAGVEEAGEVETKAVGV